MGIACFLLSSLRFWEFWGYFGDLRIGGFGEYW